MRTSRSSCLTQHWPSANTWLGQAHAFPRHVRNSRRTLNLQPGSLSDEGSCSSSSLEPQAGAAGAVEVKVPDPDASDKATSGEAGAITAANNATDSAAGQFEIPARDCRMRSPC